MRINRILPNCAYPDGIYLEIYFSGCKHHCDGCYIPELWNDDNGKEMSMREILAEVGKRIHSVDAVVLTGGDPLLHPENAYDVVDQLKKRYHKPVWLFTGYTKEEIDANHGRKRVFDLCDVVVTDPYVHSVRQSSFIGSSNQRVWHNNVVDEYCGA